MRKVSVLIIMLLASFSLKAQYLVDGESLDSIRIGKSTIDDVIANYGPDYNLKKYSDYSNALVYEKLGLIFYSCQDDPKREIFTIVMQSPFNVKTSKGIILGKSTFNELFEAYGKWNKNSAGFEYEKIGFYFNTDAEIPEKFESDNMNFAAVEKQSGKTVVNLENISPSENEDFTVESDLAVESDDSDSVSDDDSNENDQSDDNLVTQNNEISIIANSSNADKNPTEDKEFNSEIKKWGNKIVKRIELFEKGRLRQCHVDFRK